MSCANSINGIPKTCEPNNIGGIVEIYIIDQESVSATTLNTSGHTLTAIGLSGGDLYETFQFNRNVGSFTTEEATDLLVGSVTHTHTVNMMLHRREGTKSRALQILGEGQRYLSLIVKSADGSYTYFDNMRLQSANETSGVARAEGSMYTVVFTNNGDSDHKPYFVDSAIVPALLA